MKSERTDRCPGDSAGTGRGAVVVRCYTPQVERQAHPGAGIADFDVWSSRSKYGTLEPGLRLQYAPPLKPSPCRIGAGYLAGPAGIARLTRAVAGVCRSSPFVSAHFLTVDLTLVGVSAEGRWFHESRLLRPKYLFKRAAERRACFVVLAHFWVFDGSPEPTLSEIKHTVSLFGEGRRRGVHILDHVILSDTLRGAVPFFSYLAHGCLPTLRTDGTYEWAVRDWPYNTVTALPAGADQTTPFDPVTSLPTGAEQTTPFDGE